MTNRCHPLTKLQVYAPRSQSAFVEKIPDVRDLDPRNNEMAMMGHGAKEFSTVYAHIQQQETNG